MTKRLSDEEMGRLMEAPGELPPWSRWETLLNECTRARDAERKLREALHKIEDMKGGCADCCDCTWDTSRFATMALEST